MENVEKLIKDLFDETKKNDAEMGLRKIGGSALADLIRALKENSYPDAVRKHVAFIIYKMKEEAYPAINDFAEIGTDSKVPVEVRRMVLYYLGQMGIAAVSVVPILKAAYDSDSDNTIKTSLKMALKSMGAGLFLE